VADSVLITGGAGFIGSHLAEALLGRGKTVYIVDNLSTGSLENLAEVKDQPNLHVTVDTVMNWPLMVELVQEVDQVIHLAAAVGVRKILEEPVETITTNVRGTEIVLDCCNRAGKKLFVASTSEIYGKAGDRLHEDHDRILGSTMHRRWSYACTKALDEFLALAYNYDKGLPVIIGRFFNTVGPRQTGQWGMVLPTFVGQALRGEPITVYGTGDQSRCFCHVQDSIRAVQGVMDDEGALGEVFNIGHEEEITIRGLAERVKERTASDSPIQVISYDEAYESGFEDMLRRQPDTSKIRSLLNWAPTHDINGIIDSVIAHFREDRGL
jgi:UDP-glucose 4-epimerase